MISVCEPNRTLIRWSANRLLQRRQIICGMAATIAAITRGANAGAQESEIPTFRSGRFQFTILRPQQLLPSIRLFQLNGGSQCCPVNLRGIGEKANSGAAFRTANGVSDLNQK